MKLNQNKAPLLHKLNQFKDSNPISFHVPGHKNGTVFPDFARTSFDSILSIDYTELPGLDDLHAPTEAIAEAEELAADFFQADHTFFLVGGSTAGNLAMILATCTVGDKIIVQRNCHKSIMNGLELSGAKPVFIAPVYDEAVHRYTNPNIATLEEALKKHPDAKAVVLTYPDYFGKTYDLKQMVDLAHSYRLPVLVDEAHGVHLSLGDPFPSSALTLGADVVVQSAHKMAPAMTMASFLHFQSSLVSKEKIAHYLQIIQSSSPSYPLMASLDVARYYLATLSQKVKEATMQSVSAVRDIMSNFKEWDILPITEKDDPLKITFHVKHQNSAKEIATLFEKEQIYPELVTHNQILFIHGLSPFKDIPRLNSVVNRVTKQLIGELGTTENVQHTNNVNVLLNGAHCKKVANHATIDITIQNIQLIQELELSYQTMNQLQYVQVPFMQGIGEIAAEAVIPYPPGIPLILKGERITAAHVEIIEQLQEKGVRIQQRDQGIKIFGTR
ncbi:aminotransferase class I/II-fold pyridoxal phosphate-dependent enzyme [Oceanobacillus chungangensis]|uniref:Lysine decarboxylase n=1 Tax=Oceanobacillus chungangensis TaxID=1229152 RepID=A0A3D8PNK8_9BACI|nr:aminotransferase class I/II-fold pyridoxal phosphate-dependent enzyme [Oceanobacillus chungangensis]RDW16828.1 lysine decarboxylase [Oceanobacillus chungangensis]